MGIGLYVCEQIIKQHGGTLWVESETGNGATFNFYDSLQPNTNTLRMEKCILICDDDEGILDVTSMVLESNGYRVIPIINSLKVLETVRKENPDLIILDLWMPGINGEQLVEALKGNAETRDMPIIIISASRDGSAIAKQSGANDFLEKPFDIDMLTERVKQYV